MSRLPRQGQERSSRVEVRFCRSALCFLPADRLTVHATARGSTAARTGARLCPVVVLCVVRRQSLVPVASYCLTFTRPRISRIAAFRPAEKRKLCAAVSECGFCRVRPSCACVSWVSHTTHAALIWRTFVCASDCGLQSSESTAFQLSL
jgi:hypothetical protein